MTIGVPYGAMAGFLGGRVDNVMMRIVDILYSLPYMFLVILLVALFADAANVDPMMDWMGMERTGAIATWLKGPGMRLTMLFVGLGAVSWLTMARIVRGQVLALKTAEFVMAARAVGLTSPAIILRHLIPNTAGVVVVYSTLTLPAVMIQEAFLSFLGLGIQPPQASLGTLVYDGVQAMALAPWMLVFPGLFMAALLLCMNLLGDALQGRFQIGQ
jgi:oligopeptide transport system permease protein